MQGPLCGVRLARAGHAVALISRGQRAAELRDRGAIIEHPLTGNRQLMLLPLAEELTAATHADLCLVSLRRERLDGVLPALNAARGIGRVVFMINHALGSSPLVVAFDRRRVVLGFPGAAGSIENGVDRSLEVAQQPTAIEASAPDIKIVLKDVGFRLWLVQDMGSWLCRHVVFVTAVSGVLYEVGIDAPRLSSDSQRFAHSFWRYGRGAAMDRRGIVPPPTALRAIFQWVPLAFAALYRRRLLGSPRGERHFARQTRHAVKEMAALAADVRARLPNAAMPHLQWLYAAPLIGPRGPSHERCKH